MKLTNETSYPDVDYDVIPPYAWDEHGYPEVIVKRVKGQRYERGMLDTMSRVLYPEVNPSMRFHFAHDDGKLYMHDLEHPLGKIERTGYFPARNPMCGTVHRAQALIVSYDNGIIVPCTRLGDSFVVVQNAHFRSFIPKGVKVPRTYY